MDLTQKDELDYYHYDFLIAVIFLIFYVEVVLSWKWVPQALTEVEKWTQYAICHLLFFLIRIIYTSKST